MRAVWLIVLLAAAQVAAEDWPQFRGPDGQGHSAETGIPLEWSETRNVAWKVPVPGVGWSSPSVSGGLVWLTTAIEAAGTGRNRGGLSLRAVAYDAATGRERVNVEVFSITRPSQVHQKNSHASPTPIVSGDRVYVHFGAEGTAALTTDGTVVWNVDSEGTVNDGIDQALAMRDARQAQRK